MAAEPKTRAQVDAFVADLRKTKGGVELREADGEIVVRTRDGDDYRFKLKGAA